MGCLFEVLPRRLATLAMLAGVGLAPEPLERVRLNRRGTKPGAESASRTELNADQ